MNRSIPKEQHRIEWQENRVSRARKPLLQTIYRTFYQRIATNLNRSISGDIVEVGSGIADIREVIPECIRTDLFPEPSLDRVENIYALSSPDNTLSHLILFDVFHHLRYPGTALKECWRALRPGGRVLLFEPYISLTGAIVYGLAHHESCAIFSPITWEAPLGWSPSETDYYAAQGNATRVFYPTPICAKPVGADLSAWRVVTMERYAALSYVLSGGYRGPQLYPATWYPILQKLDALCDRLPVVFSTRLLVVLEKKGAL